MIQHTVTFSLVHDQDSDAERDFLDTAARELAAIPGVTDFAISRQVSPKSPLAFHFSMAFADQAAYDAYNVHPAHVAFVEGRWVPEVSDFQELDFVAR
ncbi:Dabb family protein [Plantibacter flavus]|uniref:Dabb family protein n=1 Tax=Plantibacter flavus TaxID=150123 RepID=UPI003F170DBB